MLFVTSALPGKQELFPILPDKEGGKASSLYARLKSLAATASGSSLRVAGRLTIIGRAPESPSQNDHLTSTEPWYKSK